MLRLSDRSVSLSMSESMASAGTLEPEGATLEARIAVLLSRQHFALAAAVIVAELEASARRFIRRHLGAEDEDLLQDLFERVRRALPAFEVRAAAKIRTWLLQICHNLIWDRYRARGRRDARQVALDPAGWETVAGESGSGLDREIDRKRRQQQLWWALEQLPADDRDLLILQAQQGVTFRELGARMGKSEAAVKMQYHRAREHCKALIRSLRRGRCSSTTELR